MDEERAEQFMRHALELGIKGAKKGDGGPFGAVIVKGGKIIGQGWNRVVALNDPTAHGEMIAIRNACQATGDFNLEGCELYTAGEPCPMCFSAAYWARIDRIFYGFGVDDAAAIGFDDRLIYEQLALPPDRRTVTATQVLTDEALKALEEYAADPNRVKY